MPGIYVKNLSQELVDYIRSLRGERTWAQWFREIQSDFRKKQEKITELELEVKTLRSELKEAGRRITVLQKHSEHPFNFQDLGLTKIATKSPSVCYYTPNPDDDNGE